MTTKKSTSQKKKPTRPNTVSGKTKVKTVQRKTSIPRETVNKIVSDQDNKNENINPAMQDENISKQEETRIPGQDNEIKQESKTAKRVLSLTDLANLYGTDKITHGYIAVYEKELPPNPKKFLELGVDEGKSIMMWLNYYKDKNVDIHAACLFHEFPDVQKYIENAGAKTYKIDVHKINELYQIKDVFNVIIDDSSHQPGLQQKTFNHLFINNLSNKGKYFIEDLHTSKESFWYGEHVKKFEETTLYFLQRFTDRDPVTTPFIGQHELNILIANIESVEIINEKLAIITKK